MSLTGQVNLHLHWYIISILACSQPEPTLLGRPKTACFYHFGAQKSCRALKKFYVAFTVRPFILMHSHFFNMASFVTAAFQQRYCAHADNADPFGSDKLLNPICRMSCAQHIPNSVAKTKIEATH